MDTFIPRRWQAEAADACVTVARSGSDRALVYACPGAGKTLGGLHISEQLVRRVHHGRPVLVITPNLAIRAQWIEKAKDVGLDLIQVTNARQLQQARLPLGAHGFILNYQQAIRMKRNLRLYCEATRPVVILDEVHHTASPSKDRDGNVWGDAVEYACAPCSFKLCTTGTPFREGGSPIAFVDYNEGREAVALVKYHYEKAIRDQICRPIEFSSFDGEVTWRDRAGSVVTADFKAKVSKRRARERMQAAISPKGNFPIRMFEAAHEKLQELRAGDGVDRVAGGLIVAADRAHAEAIAEVMTEITGQRPVVVHNQIDDAQDQIKAFTRGTDPWIIGINMLSEGVDIPRLRVGVYASKVRAELYFHQFCGRFMRVQESHRERSYVMLPADPELEAVAIKIEEEKYHALPEEAERRRGFGGQGRPARELDVSQSEADLKAVMFSGHVMSADIIRANRDRISAFRAGGPSRHSMSDAEIAAILIETGAVSATAIAQVA